MHAVNSFVSGVLLMLLFSEKRVIRTLFENAEKYSNSYFFDHVYNRKGISDNKFSWDTECVLGCVSLAYSVAYTDSDSFGKDRLRRAYFLILDKWARRFAVRTDLAREVYQFMELFEEFRHPDGGVEDENALNRWIGERILSKYTGRPISEIQSAYPDLANHLGAGVSDNFFWGFWVMWPDGILRWS